MESIQILRNIFRSGAGGDFAHQTTDFGDSEGFKAAKYFKKDVYSGRPKSVVQIGRAHV